MDSNIEWSSYEKHLSSNEFHFLQVTILRYQDTTSPEPLLKPGITEIIITVNNTDGRNFLATPEELGK